MAAYPLAGLGVGRRTDQDRPEAMASKESWRAWMAGPSRELERLLTAEYERTKSWSFTCEVCQLPMQDPRGHLCGRKHLSALWRTAKTQQLFVLAQGRYMFDHLTGKLKPVTGEAEQEEPVAQNATCAQPAAALPPATDAMASKASWRAWMEGPSRELEKLLKAEYERTNCWRFTCDVCQQLMQDPVSHLCGQKHLSALWKVDKSLQLFILAQSFYTFNHLTGELKAIVAEDEQIPVVALALPICMPSDLTNIEDKGPREALNPPLFQVAFLDDGDVRVLGYEAAYRSLMFSPPQQPFGWMDDSVGDGNGPTWRFSFPQGEYKVLLGLDCSRSKSSHMGILNGTPFNPTTGFFQEVVLSVAVDDVINLQIDDRALLSYLRIWPAAAMGFPVLEAPRKQFEPPPFSVGARGTPADWNVEDHTTARSAEAALFWGRRVSRRFDEAEVDQANINIVLRFLGLRKDAEDRDVLRKLGPPVRRHAGWFSLAWRSFGRGEDEELSKAGWVRAWHGCKFEALYSIIYHGRLCESRDKARGDRFFNGAPGIYVHKDETSRKAENYVRFVPLCGDGVFWAAKWEVRVNRAEAVKAPRKTDQWVQRAGSVRLAALWLCGRLANEMEEGSPVSRSWDPELEANPREWAPACEPISDVPVDVPAPAPARARRVKRRRNGEAEAEEPPGGPAGGAEPQTLLEALAKRAREDEAERQAVREAKRLAKCEAERNTDTSTRGKPSLDELLDAFIREVEEGQPTG